VLVRFAHLIGIGEGCKSSPILRHRLGREGAKSPAPLSSERIAAHRALLRELPMRSVPRSTFVLTNPINSRFVGNMAVGAQTATGRVNFSPALFECE
jgi:hypothetical protein